MILKTLTEMAPCGITTKSDFDDSLSFLFLSLFSLLFGGIYRQTEIGNRVKGFLGQDCILAWLSALPFFAWHSKNEAGFAARRFLWLWLSDRAGSFFSS